MTTAKALGLDVPTSILLSADERNTATQEDWIADGGNGSWLCRNALPEVSKRSSFGRVALRNLFSGLARPSSRP
jgi:hypothetical protein